MTIDIIDATLKMTKSKFSLILIATSSHLAACNNGELIASQNKPKEPVMFYQFDNANNCPTETKDLRFCTEIVKIPMQNGHLEIPRNYLQDWFIHGDALQSNSAYVVVRWPEWTPIYESERQLPRSVQDNIKLVFRPLRENAAGPPSFDELQDNIVLRELELRFYKKWLRYLPLHNAGLEAIPTNGFTMSGKEFCTPLSLPTCTCEGFFTIHNTTVMSVTFHAKNLKDWKLIFNKSLQLGEKFTKKGEK